MSNYGRTNNRRNYRDNNGSSRRNESAPRASHFNRPQLYDIHPISIKLIQKGNPWVTLDKFSEQFHPNDKFIVAANNRRPFALLLHDPRHSNIRGRVWSTEGNFGNQIKNFKNDFIKRLTEAFKQRKDQKILERRSNLYLLFGEADRVPGLFIQMLGDQVLIQSYTNFWDKYQDIILQTVMNQLKQVFDIEITKSDIWIQKRAGSDEVKSPAKSLDPNMSFKSIEIDEFGCKYKVTIGKHYDIGLYTDMSAVRNKIQSLFTQSEKVLNLYCYTGAFSIFALKNGAKEVTSVDLSEKYIEMLEENLELNSDLSNKQHTSLIESADESLKKLSKIESKFDLIINDPPSSSSDGQKRSNALRDYEKMLPLMEKCLSEDGKMVLFLNTHSVSKRKFSEKLEKIIHDKGLKLTLKDFLSLNSDCPSMPRFAEGSYLKGFVVQRGEPAPLRTDAPKRKTKKKTYKKKVFTNDSSKESE